MQAEAESVEGGGPTVTEADIANITAQWTGIPIEKVSSIQAWGLWASGQHLWCQGCGGKEHGCRRCCVMKWGRVTSGQQEGAVS